MYFTVQYINNRMIKIFKNFTKKKFAGLLLIAVIIIAFGFGGFGGGFNTGNQNNIAKIDNTKISTQDFMNYLNQSGLSQQVIKENINKNVLEELLSSLVSKSLLDLEVKDLNLKISKKILIEKIKKNKNFHDESNVFQRTKYEKFLLTNNMNAIIYEAKLKESALQKQLFTYIGGGTKLPNFLVNEYYKENNKKLNVEFINLNNFYKNIEDFTQKEIKFFVNENSQELKQDYIDFSFIEITPKRLTGIDDFNQSFFDKIDEIENMISENIDFETIVGDLNIKPNVRKNYINIENNKAIENIIYNSRKKNIDILDIEGSFVFYQIDKIENKLPDLQNNKFNSQIKKLLFQKDRYEFNKKILDQINENKFDKVSFENLSINGVEKIKLDSIKDLKKFEENSIKNLYSLPAGAFTLVSDDYNNIFIAQIINFEEKNISENSNIFNVSRNEANAQSRNIILKSYDNIINDKYDVTINEKTLDRVKNYFK